MKQYKKTVYLWLFSLLFTFILANFGLAQQEDIKRRLAICAAIKGDLERLAGYDQLAKELGLIKTTINIPTKGTGKWVTNVEKNPIDDSKTIQLFLIADQGKSHSAEDIVLMIRCKSNKTDFYINWQDYLGLDTTNVIIRIGNDPAINESWNLSTNNKGTFFPGSPISFIKALMTADKLVAQVTPYNENPVTAIFDIRGLAEAIKPLQETCGWK